MRSISAAKPHFYKPLLPGFENGLKIPIYFSKYVLDTAKGYPNEALLKRNGSKWRVQVVNGYFAGRGWVRFSQENDLKPYDFVVFKHRGNMVFHVRVFDGVTHCGKEIHKNGDPRPSEKPRFVDVRPHFVAEINRSSVDRNFLTLPCAFARSNGLMNRNCEIIVKDEQERSWYFELRTFGGRVDIKGGSKMAEFFRENGFKKGDLYKLEVVRVAENRPVVRVLSEEPNALPDHIYSSTIKPYSLGRHHQCLYIPMKFARQNGLCEKHKMVLEGKNGRTWPVNLSSTESRLGIRGGWKAFVDENGIKVGDAFKFEIVQNGQVPVVRFTVN